MNQYPPSVSAPWGHFTLNSNLIVMMYRAKITKIVFWVRGFYSVNNFSFVHDEKDTYIEVSTLEEADLLEDINRSYEQAERLKSLLLDKFK